MTIGRTGRLLLALPIVAAFTIGLPARQSPPGGVYSADQAAAGRAAYQANCAGCHLADLSGRNEAPPLAGANFMNTWRNRSSKDLLTTCRTMPPSGTDLPSEQCAAITAFILQANGATPGAAVFERDRREDRHPRGRRAIRGSPQTDQVPRPPPTGGQRQGDPGAAGRARRRRGARSRRPVPSGSRSTGR
jgi:mono/diheme cytochrome c family protein